MRRKKVMVRNDEGLLIYNHGGGEIISEHDVQAPNRFDTGMRVYGAIGTAGMDLTEYHSLLKGELRYDASGVNS